MSLNEGAMDGLALTGGMMGSKKQKWKRATKLKW
jgi:hypothetical protein